MKTQYRKLIYIALSTLTCLLFAITANAQRPSTGGGGGGSRPPASSGGGGGGGGSVARPPVSSGVAVSRPAVSNGGGYRGNAGFSQPSISAPRVGVTARPGYGNYTPSQSAAPRGNYGYAPRPGVSTRSNYGYAPRQGTAANGNYYSAPRVGYVPRGLTSSGGGYRTAPQIGYGRGGYWGNHNYNYYNRGYYRSYYYPRIGFTCAVLPYGYYPFYWGDYQYYYSDGLFYQYNNAEYTVVEPPVGAEITTLPEKAQSIVINGQQYYELNGVYYQPVTKDDGTLVYMVAGKDGELNTDSSTVQDDQPQGPQMGDIVTQLPSDCRKIKVNGEVLFVSPDGVYYQQKIDASGNKTYKVVGLPSDEPESN